MTTKLVRFVITYTISDDDTRDFFIELLNKINYESGDDQSTMIIRLDKAFFSEEDTLEYINLLCSQPDTFFTEGDQLSFYTPRIQKDSRTGVQRMCMTKNLYRYHRLQNKFL